MTRFHHDFETRAVVDLRTSGTSRYVRDEGTEPLMLAYAFDDGPVEQWICAYGDPLPRDVRDALQDPSVVKFAWNKTFEWGVWTHVFGIETPHCQWFDPMVLALALSLPGALADCGRAVDLPADKAKLMRGRALIKKFCVPRKPSKNNPQKFNDWRTHPEEWSEFLAYNRQDVEAERAVYRRLRRWDMPAEEWQLWYLDQEINERGIPVNLDAVRNGIGINEEISAARTDELKRLTRLVNPSSVQQLLPWLVQRGYPFRDCRKGHIARALEARPVDPLIGGTRYQRVLSLRQETARSSVKKYRALQEAADDDGRLRHGLQFAGAGRTARWAGRRFQAQNLPRPHKSIASSAESLALAVRHVERLDTAAIELLYENPLELLASCVRALIQAPAGHVLVSADLNAIENRVLGWLAADRRILDVFQSGRDPYIDFATYMFGGTYAERLAECQAGDYSKRTLAKPAVLGCGYQLGAGAWKEDKQSGEMVPTGLLGYAYNMGVEMTLEQAQYAVAVWRETFSEVVDFWHEIYEAARRCIVTRRSQYAGLIEFDMSPPFLRMGLPSGRYLYYCKPKLEMWATPWGEMRETITYEGRGQNGGPWARVGTHPGKLTENADQAVARDILANGIRRAMQEGLDVRLHIHDEIVVVATEEEAERTCRVLVQCMEEVPGWASGVLLPLAAEGKVSKVFAK